MHFGKITTSFIAMCCLATVVDAAKDDDMALPDFTKGDTVPEGATHDWNLGATGARGWIHSKRLETSLARQIYITKVDQVTPAAEQLKVGDVLLGVFGKPFSYDARVEFGKALTQAESKIGNGKLDLIVWRNGKQENVTLKLPVLGDYSSTAPFDCEKSKRILMQGCEAIAKNMLNERYAKQGAIPRALNALALLAGGQPEHLPLVKKEAEWAANFSSDGMATWYYGYVITFLAEYQLATGDESVMPGLRRLALEAANGQSIVGTWSHGFANADGRASAYGMMNSPGIPLTISLILSRKAGVDDPRIDRAIELSLKLLRFYAGKGCVPYGDHAPWMQNHDSNGKNSMAAVLFNLAEEGETAEFFSRMSLACHGDERNTGHTGNFWNITWALPGIVQSGPHATGAWMAEFGGWYFDMARRPDGSFLHQGPPSMTGDRTKNWDCSGANLLAYAMPLKRLYITGKKPTSVPQLTAEEAKSIVMDGRGWSNNNRNAAYDELNKDELMTRLQNWSPIVRTRAAQAIARRKDSEYIPYIIELLEDPSLFARYGACSALAELKESAAPAVPLLRKTLKHDDLWLRCEAARALANIGNDAMVALPELLTMLAKGPSDEDPRAMEQRFLSFAIFDQMLKRGSLDGIDQALLREAITATLKNEDGRSRGTVSNMYGKLSYEEIKPLLPVVYDAVKTPAPSGIMFAGQIRLAGLRVLSQHKIREGIPLCVEILELDKWGKKDRLKGCIAAIQNYGSAAKPLLPQLKQIEQDLLKHREAKSLMEYTRKLREIIAYLETSDEKIELRSIK